MKTIILDNYDSFTYNLFQYFAELKGNPVVYRNDELDFKKLLSEKPTHIVISPGPGTPSKKSDFGICAEVIEKCGPKLPILGVCLGHQGIGYVYGAKIVHAPTIMHGKTSMVKLGNSKLFAGLPKQIEVMRYHSLVIDHKTMPKNLRVTAVEESEQVIMGVEHIHFPTFGIQFHPESIGTPQGKLILKNFLAIKGV